MGNVLIALLKRSPSSPIKAYVTVCYSVCLLAHESDSSSLQRTAQCNERSKLNSKRYLFPRRSIFSNQGLSNRPHP